MTSSLNEYLDLKSRVEKLQREADRNAGALEQSMARLKEAFNCSTLEEAEKLLKKLTKEEAEARGAFESALNKFMEEWRSELPG